LRTYGEERFAGRVAKAIAAGRARAGDDAFRTTAQLAAVVAGAVGRAGRRPEPGKDPATRTFQALRILVNQELDELARVLDLAVTLLSSGGRLAVISFHSLEDRMVKQFVARESGRAAPDAGGSSVGGRTHRSAGLRAVLPAPEAREARLRAVARVLPSEAEVAANPRARSAVLRVAERA
jgi:16S rRNA (cytosine1402-N4)-methyltransferase